MPKNALEESETQVDIDTSSALADISSDLFGQGGDEDAGAKSPEGEKGKVSGEPSPDASTPSPQPDKTGQDPSQPSDGGENPDQSTSQPVQDVGAPKTWTKEALESWATIPPRAQQEILKREQDFLNGITQYKAGAELGAKYDAVVEPYRPILTAENVDPVQLFQSFAANHYLLSRGTPEQKVQLAANLIQSYGINFQDVIGHFATYTPPDPQITALQREIAELKSGRQAEINQVQQAQQAKVEAEIASFASDPAHPYFDELVDDIAKLFQAGLAKDLPEAYEKALYANPVTRAKAMQQMTSAQQAAKEAEEKARREKIARSTAADVTTSQTSRNGTVPLGTMDDTLAETLRSILERS